MTELKYKKFSQLLDEVLIDFHTFNLEGMIDPQQFIKIALRVNYELGLKINKSKDIILELEKSKAKLPDDFYILNYANLVGKYTVQDPVISGSHVEEVPLITVPDKDNCGRVKPCTSGCGQYYNLVQTLKSEVRTYEEFFPLQVGKAKVVSEDCPNIQVKSANQAQIRDGWIFTNLESGKIHMNYIGNLEDEDGNLLVLDHPLINEFYEYAIKQRVLENLLMNGEDVTSRIQLIEQRLRAARNNALSLVNTPDYADLKKNWEMNRKAMYGKYYNMFKR
jgi:hypothetical protein